MPVYHEFLGVRGCQDVLHLYRLLWVSTALNVLGLLLGIITAAVLGAFKDMVSAGQGCNWGMGEPGPMAASTALREIPVCALIWGHSHPY